MNERQVLTVRMPIDLLEGLKAVKHDDESLNDLLCRAAERELRRRKTEAVIARTVERREQIRARTGTHPDMTPWIRAMREGNPRDG